MINKPKKPAGIFKILFLRWVIKMQNSAAAVHCRMLFRHANIMSVTGSLYKIKLVWLFSSFWLEVEALFK